MVGSNIIIANMVRSCLQKYEDHRLLVKDHQEPEKIPSGVNPFGSIKALDLVLYCLQCQLGIRNVDISCIIQGVFDTDNAPYTNPNSAVSVEYDSITSKLIVFIPTMVRYLPSKIQRNKKSLRS